MKRTGIILALIFTSLLSIAQVERVPAPAKQPDPVTNDAAGNRIDKTGMKDILNDLDLTREQKIKLKEIRQSGKTKKEAIDNNGQLTEKEKKTRLWELQKEQARSIRSVLTDEQYEKLKVKRQEMRKEKN